MHFQAPGVAFGLIGLAFSIEPAAVWVCVPILAPTEHSALAFGILSMAINVALMIAYPLLNSLGESTQSDAGLDLIGGVVLAGLGVLLCVVWHRREKKLGHRCNRRPGDVTLVH